MDKNILQQYADAVAREKYLRKSIYGIEEKLEKMNDPQNYVADTVTVGRKGKRSLGTVVVTGLPYPEYNRMKKILEIKKESMKKEEAELMRLTEGVEEYISDIDNVELRNILSLYYIDGLNWVQVAHRMNGLYRRKKCYTDSSCRQKHDRFLKKI